VGIFDFFLKGPQLKKWEANRLATDIALMLHTKEITPRDLVINAENILEELFVRFYPDHSIEPDQSRQIFQFALLTYENDKKYLEDRERRRKFYADEFERSGDIPKIIWSSHPQQTIDYKIHLTLFKD
tara:strand:- start:153 stop:536 length:384 start_codon:yes stop_codon:yes gene_type:complete